MPLLWLSLAFLSGILLAGALALPALAWVLTAAAGVLFLLAELFLLKSNLVLKRARAALRFPAGLLLVLLALGGLRYLAGVPSVAPDSLAYYNDRGTYTITARVSAPPDRREDAVYLELTAIELEDPRAVDPLEAVRRISGKARARLPAGVDWRMGDVLRFNADPRTPSDEAHFPIRTTSNASTSPP